MKKYRFEPCGGGGFIMSIRPDSPVYLGGVYDIDVYGTTYKCYIVVSEITDPEEPFVDGKITAKYEDCSSCVGDDTTIVITEDDNNILATKRMTSNEPLLAISLDVIITDGSVEYNLWGYSIPLIQNYVGGFLDVNQEGAMDWMPNFPELAVNNKYKVVTTGSSIEVLLPILFNWRYYQSLPTLAAIFGQNATKNWRWYQENGWQIKAKISTLTDVGSYIDEVAFEVRDYDDNSEVNWTWEMFRESTLDPITAPISGEKAIIKVTADMPSNTTETIDYATVTVEGFEQPTRWLISSVYEHLNQSNSPLQPMQFEDRLKLTNITGANNSVELEFIFDASKISSNKVKFTGRIYQQGGGDYTERNVQTFEIPFLPPEQKEPEYEAGECCDCPSELKLASLTSDELRENDITGVVHKNQTSGDTCTFEIYKNGELLPNNGVDFPNGFPYDDKVSAFVYNWKYYLVNYGLGCYEIKKRFTIAGLEFERSVGNYELKEYTPQNAKGTARVLYQNNFETLFDDQIINFADSGFEDSYRFEGFFGKWQPNVISESDFSVRNENRVSSIKSKDNYRLIISGAGECEIKRIHKIVMSAAVWRVSDHNPSNALQEPIIYECVLDKENSEEITYHDGSKISDVEIILSKRQQNSVSLFNGSLQLVQGATWLLPTVTGGGGTCLDATVTNGSTYSDTVASGGALLLPSENITVNGNLLVNKPSVEDYDVEVVDSLNNPIGVVSGGKVVVSELPCSKELEVLIPYSSGDGTATITIVTDSDGTITTEDTAGLTNVTHEVNSVPTTLPFTLAVGDVLTINFDTASADGVIKLEGTYA